LLDRHLAAARALSRIIPACFASLHQAVSNARINPPPDDAIQST
jgi:hypothetical protein